MYFNKNNINFKKANCSSNNFCNSTRKSIESHSLIESYHHSSPSQESKFFPKGSNKKIDFKCIKHDTLKSLNEVEHFLCNFSSFNKFIKIYNLFKK